MDQTIVRLKEKWKSIGLPVKIGIGAVGLGLIIFLLFTFFMPSKYQVLYSGLTAKDMTNIEKYLSSKGIDYTSDSTAMSISVSSDPIQLKKDLALQGLPTGGTSGGLDQFNNISLGATQYDKNVQYQNALQNELDNSLESMFDGIQSADVKLPLQQQQSVFDTSTQSTNVSVALKLAQGYQLSPSQVKAVQVYVAGAMNNVKPTDVQVVDQNFNLLSGTDTNSTDLTLSKEQQITNATEMKLENQLESALSEVYGKVRVIVNPDINFDQIVQNTVTYDPKGTVLASSETTPDHTRQVTGNDASISPGTGSNGQVPTYQTTNVPASNILSTEDKDHIIQNFDVGKTAEKIIKEPSLRNTNISVWFDNTKLTQSDLKNAEEMVAVASGLTGQAKTVTNNKEMYDNGSVKVIKMKFANDTTTQVQTKTVNSGFLNKIPWYIYLGVGILILFLIGIIIFLLIRSKKKNELEDEEEDLMSKNPFENKQSDNENGFDIEPKSENETEEEIFKSMGGKFNIEWNEKQRDLRKITNEVAKRFPKETAEVLSKILKK